MNKIKKIVFSAFIIAIIIVLSRFLAIRTPILSITFSFIAYILAGIYFKPVYAGLLLVIADIIGALLFPSGAFFIGWTLSAFITGAIYSIVLHNNGEIKVNRKFIFKLFLSSLLVLLIVNGTLNTIWIKTTIKSASSIVIPLRIVKQLAMLPIQIVTMTTLIKALEQPLNNLKKDLYDQT